MSGTTATPLKSHFWVLLRIPPTSSANGKLRIWSITEGISSHQFVSSFHTCSISNPMSQFLCKSILFQSCTARTLPPTTENSNAFPLRCLSSSSNQQSFTVSYLVRSLGLSSQSAFSVSKNVNLKSLERPDKVINLFKKYGFTQTQISSLVSRSPCLLLFDAEKIILPKFAFFEDKGISGPEMAKLLTTFPRILSASLAKQIIPSYDFFSKLFDSGEKVIAVIQRFPDILTHNIEKFVSPKIDILREHRVSDSNITRSVILNPRVFTLSLDKFRKTVEKVGEMGFDSSKGTFVVAVHAFISMSESTWKSKVDAYKKCGWSEEEVLKAYRRCPWCMTVSEDKIVAAMDFFINKMGLTPCLIAKCPRFLTYSLKKRLIPRSFVFQVLLSKGLVKKEVNLSALFDSPEKKFLQKFVAPYKKEAPELLELYKEKLNLSNKLFIDKV
ncbi:hypothetical protein TIFTF001_031483 [Ficus carica]|uniref:Uncharacterized protein n=1 Tax=Ficus carica TaxID=3494 RepID=A0AA88DVD2_FICCA|nr:hypothetical protein TIFTF001_031483 [Ficus carica]